MWDLPRPRLESVSPALAGGFLTTVPPGKPMESLIILFGFTIDFLGLPRSIIISSANRDSFTFPILMSLIGFSCLLVPANISSTLLNGSETIGNLALRPILVEIVLVFLH